MPRIRSLKPELWLSPQIMNLSRDGRLLFIGLITQADDEGRGVADPRKLKAAIFPGDDDITATRIRELQAEIESQDLAIFYTVSGHGALYSLPGFTTHQSINKASRSRYPAPPKAVAKPHSDSHTERLPERSGSTPEGSDLIGSDLKDLKDRRGSKGEGRALNSPNGSRAPKPTDAELRGKALALLKSGTGVGDTVKVLMQYGVTEQQVRTWAAEAA